MYDIQSELDKRGLALDLVGIKRTKLPLKISLKGLNNISTHAIIDVLIALNHNQRGTHMSRMVQIFNDYLNVELNPTNLKKLCIALKSSLKTESVYIDMEFDIFLPKVSPISLKESYLDYHFILKNQFAGRFFSQDLIIQIPVMLLCPCSKAISVHNAHNQRAIVTLKLFDIKNLNIKKVVELSEKEASSQIYPLLKRVDEKYVTEFSYDNPKFVEDITRDIALNLRKVDKIGKFVIECESMESIHNHNAYAKIVIEKL